MKLNILVLAILLQSFVSFSQKNTSKKNVLFIAIDDLNSCLKGMDGELKIETPNINQLSKKGILFTNAHCAAPACNPSRVSVITGIQPSNSGLYMNNQDWRKGAFFKDKTTLPQHFKNNGYKTLGGGKIYHAASLSEEGYTGYLDARPWDAYYPSKNRQMPQEIKPVNTPVIKTGNYLDWAELNIETNEMADAKVVAWAEENLSKKHDQPLFLAVGIYRPHIPWYTPKSFYDRHPLKDIELPEIVENDLDDVPKAGQKMARRSWHKWMKDHNKWKDAVRAYKASVSFTDEMVGRLLKALYSGPLADNTIVVLWSDHGYHLGQKEHWEKFALWEQTTRVPLIISAPGKFKKAKKCSEPVSLLDLYPTLNELCDIPLQQKLDGESLIPLLKKPSKKTNRTVIITQKEKNHAIRSDKWRYIRYQDGSEELYDQEKDPKNFVNLASKSKYKSVIEKLKQSLPTYNAVLSPKRSSKKRKK